MEQAAGLRSGRRLDAVVPDQYAADAVFFGFQNFQSVTTDFQAYRGFGDGFQCFSDQAVQGFRAIARQLPAQAFVQLADGRGAIHHVTAVGQWFYVRIVGVLLVFKLTDDLFKNVLKGHDAQYFAVFIHHDADAPLLFMKVEQL